MPLNDRIGTGINLGQTFENHDHPRDASSVSPRILAYSQKGFKSIRIPVTWYPDDKNGACVLDDSVFMQQLDNAIYYAVSLGMCVVLNSHFENWLMNNYDGTEQYNGKFWALWRNIATRYKGINEWNLVFEVLNEPNKKFGDWQIGNCNNSTCLAYTRQINKVGFDGIRNVQSNRWVMLSPNASQCYSQCGNVWPDKSQLPGGGSDKYLICAVHNYEPSNFTLEWGSNSMYMNQSNPFGVQQNDITKYYNYLTQWQASMGGSSVIQIAITEFGIGDSGNTNRRNCDLCRTWYRQVAKGARDRGFMPLAWCDCGWFSLSTMPPSIQWVDGLADACLGY
jgi:endoglucanase